MTAIKSWTIQCDGCGDSDGGDLGALTAQDRRREVRAEGWSVNAPGGTDWCPECKQDGLMRAALFRYRMRRGFTRGARP